MRLFTAIELPEPVRRHLAHVQAQLKRLAEQGDPPQFPAISWTKESNLHVTMKFLGDVPDERLPGITDALAGVKNGASPLRLHAAALDAFPTHNSIRVLHARVDGDVEPLAALHHAIEAQCEPLGCPKENRRFRAHVTMGRPRVPLRGAWELLQEATAGRWPGPAFEASEISLVQSRLNPAGAVYTTLATFPIF